MKKEIRQRLTHALTAMLLTAGVLMPLLGVMERSFLNPRMLIASAVMIILFEIVTIHRISSLIAAALVVTGILIWGFSPGGTRILSDLTIAVSLRIRGVESALPLIADPAIMIITGLITMLCCISCVRKSSFIPVLLLCLAASVPVWLAGRTDLIPWLLPGLAAMLSKMMTSGFPETQSVRILPWAAAVVMLAFLAAGNGASIPALKEKADEFRKSVMDRLFFTEARDVFSLYSAGFSPQGPDQLGGKPDPSDDPVMMVTTPKITYLRGAIYDEYTGHGWRNTAGGKRYLWQSDRLEEERIALFDQNLPSETIRNMLSSEFTVSIRMLCDSTSTLFVPQRIRDLVPGSNMVPYFSRSSEVFITRNLQSGDIYTVRAPLYHSEQSDIGNLVEICGSTSRDSVWENMPDIYLQLPDHLEPSVYELARRITGDAGSDYGKAVAVREYLKKEYKYTMEVENHPENFDFVTTFLLNTQKGYCTYFASAMTILCRMNGLPARYVEGYLAEPDAKGEACVTGMNAHAWTEVYFKGFGWLTFDATPGNHISGEDRAETADPDQPQPTPTPTLEPPAEETPPPEPSHEPTPGPSDSPTPSPADDTRETTPSPSTKPEQTPTPPDPSDPKGTDLPRSSDDPAGAPAPGNEFPWFLIPVILFLLLCLRIIMTSPSVRAGITRPEDRKAAIWIQELSDLLAAENILRKKGETLLGFSERVDRNGLFSTLIRPAGEAASLMIYSRNPADQESTSLIRDTGYMLRSEISKPAKLKYWIRRIFLPVSRRDWQVR